MKLLFCQACADIVVPSPVNFTVRSCSCARHSVWWEDSRRGILRVHDRVDPQLPYPSQPRAFIIGLSNLLLTEPNESLNAGVIQELIDEHPDTYLFKRWRSLVIRIRPGESGDTAWAGLP